jgi:hypothetical protein
MEKALEYDRNIISWEYENAPGGRMTAPPYLLGIAAQRPPAVVGADPAAAAPAASGGPPPGAKIRKIVNGKLQ